MSTTFTAPPPASTDWVPLGPGPGSAAYGKYARVWRQNSSQSIPNTTWTTIAFDTIVNDNDGIWSASNPTRLTAKTAGFYVFGCIAYIQNPGGNNRRIRTIVNGSLQIGDGGIASLIAVDSVVCVSNALYLNVGDYIEFQAYQDSGGAQPILNLNAYSPIGWMAMTNGPAGPPGPAGPGTATYGTTLPSSPYDGQEAILVDSASNPTYQWRFRYNASSTSTYKWECVGGIPAYAISKNDVGCIADGAFHGQDPGITLNRAGDYRVEMQARFFMWAGAQATLALLNAGTSPAWITGDIPYIGAIGGTNAAANQIATITYTGAPAGAIATIGYQVANAAANIGWRTITVIPIRVS